MRVLVVGCGYVGRVVAELFAERSATCFGLKRNPADLPSGVTPLVGDVTRDDLKLPGDLDVIVYGVAAGESSDERYRQVYVEGLRRVTERAQAKQRFFFISSTSVFGQSDGGWVDETTPASPSHFTAERIMEAERVLLDSGQPITVLRAGGIYGPGRTRLLQSVRAGTARAHAGYTNRIHRDDLARCVLHLSARSLLDELYLAVDDEPVTQAELTGWMARQLDVTPPVEQPLEQVRAASRRFSNKRCRNQRLRDTGFDFEYPTFREGYAPLVGALLRDAD